jgi:hypothetical protein
LISLFGLWQHSNLCCIEVPVWGGVVGKSAASQGDRQKDRSIYLRILARRVK